MKYVASMFEMNYYLLIHKIALATKLINNINYNEVSGISSTDYFFFEGFEK